LTEPRETRIQLCGRLAVTLEGRRLEDDLPGRQGRLLFVYLAARRLRPVSRAELAEALWPEQPPSFAADAALSPLLSRLRRALGSGFLEGRSELRLALPGNAWIDLEVAAKAVHRAESAVALEDWGAASIPARIALHVARREFLPGYDAPWIDEQRRALHDLRIRALESLGTAALGLGGTELASAERSAHALVELALEIIQVEPEILGDVDPVDLESAVGRELDPGRNSTVVIEPRDQNPVAFLPVARRRARKREVEHGHVRPEDHVVG